MKISKHIKRIFIFVIVLTIVLTFPGSIGLGYAGLSSIESPVYAINHAEHILHGIGLSTTDTALKANLSNSVSSLVITKSDGSAFGGGSLCTGMSVTLFEDSVAEDSLKIAICGDPSGDGSLSIGDYTLSRLHILGLKQLKAEYKTAADINGDGLISIADYTLMRLSILGLKEIVPYDCNLPLTGYVVGIDPGHQAHANYEQELVSPTGTATKAKVSAGTYGRFTGVREYIINLQVALKLKSKLEELGATVIMSRESHDVDISNAQRAIMMNDSGADCWIRIHANGSNDPGVKGMFFLIPTPSSMNTTDSNVQTKSTQLAECLSAATLSSTSANDLGITQRSDQTGFCWSSIPVCTIEMGHMTNEQEDNLLVSDAYQEKIAQGLADGFLKYFY
jgi:N-acetylmuramoyl-L-alanine amidase